MPTKGVLNRGTQFTVEVNAAGANVGFVSTDVSSVVRIPQINNLQIYIASVLSTPPGIVNQLPMTAGANVVRVIIDVSLPLGGSALVKVNQGANRYEDQVVVDSRFVYDVVP